MFTRNCIHPGAAVSGNIVPERMSSGNINVCWMDQNTQSCPRTAKANA